MTFGLVVELLLALLPSNSGRIKLDKLVNNLTGERLNFISFH